MKSRLLPLLACPHCHSEVTLRADRSEGEEVIDGTLDCRGCGAAYPIRHGIPRFIDDCNYAESFGFQWQRFRTEQIDSENATRLSERRVLTETGWTPEWLRGRWVAEIGCGAGRFLEPLARNGGDVVGVDISNAIDAARANLSDRPNVHFVQASVYELPFRDGAFDGCYSIGVMQHTPDPERAIRALPRIVRMGGAIALTMYERRRFTKWNAKYLVRPLTRRIPPRRLLTLVRAAMPIAFPLSEVLFRIPVAGRLFRFLLPVANYVEEPQLTLRQRYQWAVLDTFDMLSPAYDAPQREASVRRYLEEEGAGHISRLPNPGLNLVAIRETATRSPIDRATASARSPDLGRSTLLDYP